MHTNDTSVGHAARIQSRGCLQTEEDKRMESHLGGLSNASVTNLDFFRDMARHTLEVGTLEVGHNGRADRQMTLSDRIAIRNHMLQQRQCTTSRHLQMAESWWVTGR